MENTPNLPPTYIRQRQLLKLLPFSSATLWRLIGRGEFPKPMKLSRNVTAWSSVEIGDWLKSRSGNNAQRTK